MKLKPNRMLNEKKKTGFTAQERSKKENNSSKSRCQSKLK